MGKVYTVAIIGCGSRGQFAYGKAFQRSPERFKIIALCDCNPSKLNRSAEIFGVSKENLYLDEKEFFKEKRADLLVIATQDRDHVRMAVRAEELGYDILLEKPISPLKEELLALLETHKKYKRQVAVCHVLRYAPTFVKVKELLDSGAIGRLVRIESIEQVAYWHQAHSFVRGNWRNDAETSPMIIAKCCHDLDLLQYYAGDKCEKVYSVGDLTYFNRKNQPKDAADRCADCKYNDSCPYSAESIYIKMWKKAGKPENTWPYNVITDEVPNTEENLRAAYEKGPYGRCVFACDNNVVDNQSVEAVFVNGVKATLTMTAFTNDCGRKMTFHGTLGEIILDESARRLTVSKFGEESEVIDTRTLAKPDAFGHGGGDSILVDTLYDMVSGNGTAETSLERSVESHLMALAAEESRKSGKPIYLHDEG